MNTHVEPGIELVRLPVIVPFFSVPVNCQFDGIKNVTTPVSEIAAPEITVKRTAPAPSI